MCGRTMPLARDVLSSLLVAREPDEPQRGAAERGVEGSWLPVAMIWTRARQEER